MAIAEGQDLPEATLLGHGANGPEPVELATKLKGRKVVIFGLPGAFTRTCSAAHVPSFIRTHGAFREKGVDEIICVAVNDPFVMDAWGAHTGGAAAGLTFLADPEGSFTRAMGMDFSAPPVGLIGRSKRYAMVVKDGRVVTLHEEEGPGTCELSGGEALLATL